MKNGRQKIRGDYIYLEFLLYVLLHVVTFTVVAEGVE